MTFESSPPAPVRFHDYANLTRDDAAEVLAEKGCVYCIGPADARVVKLGWSRDPEKRLHELQTGSPVDLRLLAIFPATERIERSLHEVFADCRIRGEWFDNADGRVVDVVRGLLDQFFPVAA